MEVDIVKILPSLLWFILAVAICIFFYRPIRDDIIPNLTAFKAMGVEFSFVKQSMDAAIKLADKTPQWDVVVSSEDRNRVLNRAKKNLSVFKGAWFLWVDDSPENNLNERKMFRQLGVEIDLARNTEEALKMLRTPGYDLVLSDMARGLEPQAGLDFLHKLRQTDQTTPVIFYVGTFAPEKGIPPGSFGITNRPDELLHMTMDILERKKY